MNDKVKILLLLIPITILVSCLESKKRSEPLFEVNANNYILSSAKELEQEKSIQIDLPKYNDSITLRLGRDYPNGTRIEAIRGNHKENLIFSILPNTRSNFFDEYGYLNGGYYIQMSCVDLDKDSISEIVVSIGNKAAELESYIFQIQDSDTTPFEYIGYVYK